MHGRLDALGAGVVLRGLGPGLLATLMAAPLKKVVRAQLKKIYVLDDSGDMAGEYVLDPDTPIDYNDFLKVLPEDGIGDRESLFVGEYVFTAFQSGKFVFVLLSRGQLSPEDFDWTALLLSAADSHLAAAATRLPPARPSEAKSGPAPDTSLAEREARVAGKETELTKLEAKLKADAANVKGRAEELDRQKVRLSAISDYVTQLQHGIAKGMSKARKSLEMAEQYAATATTNAQEGQRAEIAAAQQQFQEERKAVLAARTGLEERYREAVARASELESEAKTASEALAKERADAAAREAEAEQARAAIEEKVQDLSQRFAGMAKERLLASHRPAEPSPAALQALETEKAQLAKERKFLQRRAIEVLEREEQTRDAAAKLDGRESALRKREDENAAREAELAKGKAEAPTAAPAAGATDLDAARRDLEHRVKIIQQKALDLLEREERLRKRAAEIEEMETRLGVRASSK